MTAGDDFRGVHELMHRIQPGESFYTAADVINYRFGDEQQGHKVGDQLLAGSI